MLPETSSTSSDSQNTPRRKWWHDIPDLPPPPKKEKAEHERVKQPPNQLTLSKLARARLDCCELSFAEGIEAFRRRDRVGLLAAYDEYKEACWRYTNGDPVRFEELDKHLREFHCELVIDNDAINNEPCSKLPHAVAARFIRLQSPLFVKYFDFPAPSKVTGFPQISTSARNSAYIAVAMNKRIEHALDIVEDVVSEVGQVFSVPKDKRGDIREQSVRQLIEALAQSIGCSASLEPLNTFPPGKLVVKQPVPLPVPVNGAQVA